MEQRTNNIRAILTGNLDPAFIRQFMAANWVVMALLVIGSSFLSSPEMSAGILLGGIIANLNCVGLNKDCKRMMRWRSMAAYYAGMAVRMGLIALAVTVAILFFKETFSPIGLFIGLSVAVINFYLLVIAMLIYRVKFKEAV
ncbi:MAG: ATP synthase subunit I [Thermodesulfobacteria bacterium]|nr:ATP synthase subunit I [Thermodesulfobacteriota bacterium]